MGEEPDRSEPIVERDDDGTLFREPRAVVAFFAAEPGEETAAVDPDHHGALQRPSIYRVRPDVEKEAVLRDAGGERIDVAVRLVLDAVVAELICGVHTAPVLRWLRRLPAQLADWRRGVGDAAEDHHAGGVEAFEGAGVDRDARWGVDARCAKGGKDRGPGHGDPHHRSIKHFQRCIRPIGTATDDYRP